MSKDPLDDLMATEDYLNDDGGAPAPSSCTVDSIVRCPHCGAGQGSFYRSGTVTPSDRTPRAPFVTRCYECQGIVKPNPTGQTRRDD